MNSFELTELNNEESYYEVKNDETLRSIAVSIGTITASQLARYNGLVCDSTLYKGQKVYIPSQEQIKNMSIRRQNLPSHSSSKPKSSSSTTHFNYGDSNYPYPIITCDVSNEDVFEMKFLKLKTRFINVDECWYIDGILLVTEDYFCFDSSENFYSIKGEIIRIKQSPFNIKIPISSVVSFNTHASISKLMLKNSKDFVQTEELAHELDHRMLIENKELSFSEPIFIALRTKTVENDPGSIATEFSDYENISLDQQFYTFMIDISQLNDLCSIMLKAKSFDPGNTNSSLKSENSELNFDLKPPECSLIGGKSYILDDSMLEDLATNLPVHWFGHSLKAMYISEVDGYSLNTMYRKSCDAENAVVLLIKDSEGSSFGAIMNETMKISSHFYGTGETCVFHWNPKFKIYTWTQENTYFLRGSGDSFMIGSEKGFNAIWFDEALKNGHSKPTNTFNNPSLCSCNEKKDSSFIIDKIELWELTI